MDAFRSSLSRGVVPVQGVRGDEPRVWTDSRVAIVDLFADQLSATDRR